jgi:hypothetical protein
MSSPRSVLALAGAVLAIVLASVGGLAYVTLRTGPLAERLVGEVDALTRARHPRPSHVTPALRGTFAEHVAPLMGDVARLYRAQLPLLQASASGWPCLDGVEGRVRLSQLPPACLEALEQGRAVMARVLAATHAEDGGLPEGLRELDSPKHPHAPDGRPGLLLVVRLAALETRVRLEGGRAAEAVDTCVDALALSREVALGGGLIGHMVSAMGHGLMYRPCADALDAAPMERKRSAATQLARLAEGLAPFSRTLREESASVQLLYYGGLMPAQALAALPAGARDVVLASPGGDVGDPIHARLSWRKSVRMFDALAAVADQSPVEWRRGFQAVALKEASALYPVEGLEVSVYAGYAERAERLRFQHGALMALVAADLERAQTGRWPQNVTTLPHNAFVLESSGPAEALLKPCASAMTEHGLRVTADVRSGSWTR